MRAETRNVSVSVTGLHNTDAGAQNPDEIVVKCRGTARKMKDVWYVHYTEYAGETGEKVENLLTIRPDSFEVVRRGDTYMQLVFEQGSEMISEYRTPFGRMALQVSSSYVSVCESDTQITAKAQYRLEIDAQKASDAQITIVVADADRSGYGA